ncbi:DUF2550 domain-containing protein [Corynebacterium qintianiae]|uniref:DUF2550 domain-containing protein n=1 Tax=Corynebacterium qintianiae TaxID=2709392 RepID=UPI0013EA45DD|nr:DUF2550 domain-containing protein [Corynebacterium qintianiae]
MEIVGYVFVAAGLILLLAALWRFTSVRNHGSQGLLRQMPAEGVHGWRHGVFLYSGESLKFYKLRSLAFKSDIVLCRRGTEVEGFRDVTDAEQEIMPDIDRVLVLGSPSGTYEFASDRRARMALVSWLESAPHERQMRRDLKVPAQRAQRGRAYRS